MLWNPSRLLFLSTLFIGTLLAVSSSSWLGCWIGLEVNLLSFIPMMTKKSQFASESALKYFLVQALASAVFLMGTLILMNYNCQNTSDFLNSGNLSYLVSSALLLKMGAAPMHFWFPGVMEGLEWFNNLILMTWQKIAPFLILSYVISCNLFFNFIIMMSVFCGSIGGLNQTSLRKIMAYSSINHLGWMLSALMIKFSLWMVYFLVYVIISFSMISLLDTYNLNHTLQIYNMFMDKSHLLILFCNLLSMGGLPPFLGFLPKWLIIQALIELNNTMLVLFMVIFTLVALFFYVRLAYPAFMLTHSENKWSAMLNNKFTPWLFIMSSMNLGGLIFASTISFLL